ncbi:hypothetical protein [Rhizobium sp. FY34]|uniref:hypothetical protein n=1 Tax=Rhizobium sp. FY34 TaxID=2562309 RepID=UPI0010C01FC7|nr:hypothetical protein [Rhizobium sp. FY34]
MRGQGARQTALTARTHTRHQIVARSDELVLHQIHDLHGGHNAKDGVMDLQARRLVAGCLADPYGLYQIAASAAAWRFVAIVAGEEDKLACRNLHVRRTELRL